MGKEIDFLKNFVEGKIDINCFEEELYGNNDLKMLLEDNNINWMDTYLENSNPYLRLLELNYKDFGDRLNAQGVVELFLKKIGIEFNANEQFRDDFNLILDSMPKYLNVKMGFIQKYIFPTDKNISKKEKKEYMKQKFKEYFRYHNKPPHWIQSPKWIIKNDTPLYFLGQKEIKDCELFHDNGAIYIFINVETKEVETVIQLY